MPLTVKDACELHPMALDFAMGEQIENIAEVINPTPERARAFFEKNFVTQGMRVLLDQGLKRLADRSDQAVFELKQAMGGGKTHSMIALGLLARGEHVAGGHRPRHCPRRAVRVRQGGRHQRPEQVPRGVPVGRDRDPARQGGGVQQVLTRRSVGAGGG